MMAGMPMMARHADDGGACHRRRVPLAARGKGKLPG